MHKPGLACNVFAVRTLEAIRPIILSLGTPVLKLIANAPALKREGESLAEEANKRVKKGEQYMLFSVGRWDDVCFRRRRVYGMYVRMCV